MLPLYITSFFITAILGVSAYLFVTNPNEILALIKDRQIPEKQTVVKVEKSVITDKVVKTKAVIEKVYIQNVLTPSFQFVNDLEVQAINYKNTQLLAAVAPVKKTVKRVKKKTIKKPKKQKRTTKPKAIKKPVKKAPAPKKKVVKPTRQAVKKEPSKTILLGDNSNNASNQSQHEDLVQVGQNSTSKDQLRSVIKRFNKTKKPALSLFISKKYYEQGNYKESYHYARETYKLNPKIEDGVLLYAQSLAKLGKSDTAIKKLKPYIKKSGSIKAKILLNELQQGNFK